MTGPSLVALRTGELPDAWAAAGFTVEHGTVRIGPLVVECGGPTAEMSSPSLVFDRPHPGGAGDLDGVPWRVAAAVDATAATAASAHSNGVDGFDHVVIMSPDLARIRGALLGGGFEIRRERPTTMMSAAMTQLFAWAGPVLVEVVAPIEASGDDSGSGSSVWGIAVTSSDLDATATEFGTAISAPKAAVQSGRRIATVRHRALGIALPIAIMSAR